MRIGTVILLAAAWGCSASVGGPGATTNTDGSDDPEPVPEDGAFRLEILGSADLTVARGMSLPLRVRYTDPKGEPVAGQVSFEIDGDAGGATLPARAAQCDADGVAEIALRGGAERIVVAVVASADGASSVRFRVSVTIDGSGDLEVAPQPEGDAHPNAADVYLYEGGDCANIDVLAPPPADLLQSTASLREHPRFSALPSESVWTVLVLGIGDAGFPVASGCVTGATVIGGTEVVVEVPLRAVPLRVAGTFAVESHFLVTDSLPSDARNALEVLAEIADDPDDPASFFLDQLGEAIDDGAIELAWQLARDVTGLDETINDIILDETPDFLWDSLEAAGDVAELLEDVRVDSVLTVTEEAAEGADGAVTRTARHELVDLVFELDGVQHRYAITDDVGIRDTSAGNIPVTLEGEDRVRIAPHGFRAGLGTLTRFALNEIVLPQLPGRPSSLAELVSDALPCDWIGEELAYQVGLGSESFWEGVCEVAGAMTGQYLEARILELDERWDRLEIEGVAAMVDRTIDRTVDDLEDGDWNSALTGPAGRLPVAGTFEAVGEPQGTAW